MALARFVVTLHPGATKVAVEGVEVPGVTGVRVEASDGAVPVIFLRVNGALTIEGIGEVAPEPVPVEDAEALDGILAAVDPALLEKDVLDSFGMGDTGAHATARAHIAVLRRYLRGN